MPKGSLYVPITPVLLRYPLSLHIKGRSFYLKDSQGLWESRGDSVRACWVWLGGNEVMGCQGVLKCLRNGACLLSEIHGLFSK